MHRTLILYKRSQTFTNTVFNHLKIFSDDSSFSRHQLRVSYLDLDIVSQDDLDTLNRYDSIGIHYSIRLPYSQLTPVHIRALRESKRFLYLFLQDEYDHTNLTSATIQELGVGLVFSCVPSQSIETIYPPAKFPGTKFISVLTGYTNSSSGSYLFVPKTSNRPILIGYRGRSLPLRYGQLGFMKREIGEYFTQFLSPLDHTFDISVSEDSRLYGKAWSRFLCSCRASLGSESGSNVFDFDGTLSKSIASYQTKYPNASPSQIYQDVVSPHETPSLMNQISPRIFEYIEARSAMILLEGQYSNLLEPYKHYIPVRHDYSNLDEVLSLVLNDGFVDEITENAYRDIYLSGRYDESVLYDLLYQELASHLPIASDKHFSSNSATRRPLRPAPPSLHLRVIRLLYTPRIYRRLFPLYARHKELVHLLLSLLRRLRNSLRRS